MLRIVLEWFALLVAPMLAYVFWTVWVAKSHRTAREALTGAPFVLLFFVGVVLVFLAMILARSREEAKSDKVYTPPVYKDGKIIPGHVK